MKRRLTGDPVDRTRFGADPWVLVESRPEPGDPVAETLFAVANGYLGLRGGPDEGSDAAANGAFVNGFHETWPIRHAEWAYGFAHTGQTVIEVPDPTVLALTIDGEALALGSSEVGGYRRELGFRDGVLRRDLTWRTASGVNATVNSTRMVTFDERTLAVLTLSVTVDADASVSVRSEVVDRIALAAAPSASGEEDPRRAAAFAEHPLVPAVQSADGRLVLGYRTHNSGMTLAIAADHVAEVGGAAVTPTALAAEPFRARADVTVALKAGETLTVTKYVVYHTAAATPVDQLAAEASATIDRALKADAAGRVGAARHHAAQRAWLDAAWASGDVEVTAPGELGAALQQATRFSLFSLLQAAARADGLGIGAKGQTASGYEGHYFWDTEIYVVPYLTYSQAAMARDALSMRVGQLPAARRRARELSQAGVLFPWRSINGEEASAYFPAGTAQVHIDADVAHAFAQYAAITGDRDFLETDGAVVLAETARFWADLGFWSRDAEGLWFHIHEVTGPDEYSALVNDNLYTNAMAAKNLRRAAALVGELKASAPERYAALVEAIGLAEGEAEEWARCADQMAIPFDAELGIHGQDAHFLERKIWDPAVTPDDLRPLLLHFHPLVIYRYQILKQADLVLAMFLAGDRFTPEQRKANFDYYDPITTGDSTLSAVVQSIMAAEVGYRDLALQHFFSGMFVDVANLHDNTRDGVHIASAGGVWNALVYGFAGMRDHDGVITFDPRLPASWEELRFALTLCGARVRVRLASGEIGFTLETGDAVGVAVRGAPVEVRPGAEVVVTLDGQGPDLGHPPIAPARGVLLSDGTEVRPSGPNIEATREGAPPR